MIKKDLKVQEYSIRILKEPTKSECVFNPNFYELSYETKEK